MVVVNDGTKLFVEAGDLQVFAKLGAQLLAYRGIHITGITLNPFSPMGGSFDAQEFLSAARKAFPNDGISDVMLEAQSVSDPISGCDNPGNQHGIADLAKPQVQGSAPHSA
jgi:hypothetical protein